MEKNTTIKQWSTDDRPREKMLMKGVSSLSDAELIAVLIGSGTKSITAVDLAKQVLQSCNNNLDDLGRITIKDLMKSKGVGEVKALVIAAALEIGRRRKDIKPDEKRQFTNSAEAYKELEFIRDLNHEEFWLLLLNRANRLIQKVKLSSGGIVATVVDPKLVYKHALDHLASSIILAHNHPSGSLRPSQHDLNITAKLVEAGKMLDILVADHLIITIDGYFSFSDEGLLRQAI